MSAKTIPALLDGIGEASPTLHAIVLTLRDLVQRAAPGASEEVKYGGLYYSAARPFCGIFGYSEHVALEFTRGAELNDRHGRLLGKGQYRRHLRFTAADDIDAAVISAYIAEAFAKA